MCLVLNHKQAPMQAGPDADSPRRRQALSKIHFQRKKMGITILFDPFGFTERRNCDTNDKRLHCIKGNVKSSYMSECNIESGFIFFLLFRKFYWQQAETAGQQREEEKISPSNSVEYSAK